MHLQTSIKSSSDMPPEMSLGQSTSIPASLQLVSMCRQVSEYHVECLTDRSSGHPVVSYVRNGTTTTASQNCSKLVLAFPPVMHALQVANLDISNDENIVFSPVGTIKYWSGAVRVATPNGDTFAGFLRETFLGLIAQVLGGVTLPFGEFIPWLPEAAGQPVAMVRLFNSSDIGTTWSWGAYQSNQTLAEANTLLKDTLSRINKDPTDTTAIGKPVTDDDVMDFREWDYFPHYDQAQLDQGFYAKFNSLQGSQNTYYVSGLNGFETVEFAIRAGIDVVDTYFSTSNASGTAGSTSKPTSTSGAERNRGGLGLAISLVVVLACAMGFGPGLRVLF
jgi:hypothetical protein